MTGVLAYLGLAAVVTAAMAVLDFAHVRHQVAVADAMRGEHSEHRAGRWSVAGWAAVSVGFYLTVSYSMALLPFEGIGLYLGSIWATRAAQRRAQSVARSLQ